MEKTKSDTSRSIRICCDGVFDLFHFGHARLFKNCKAEFERAELVVGTTTDEDTLKLKGKQVMNEHERKETLKQCKWVDEVVSCPWIITVVSIKFDIGIS